MKRNGIKALGVPLLGALVLFLASCGQQPPPSNGGGGGGGSTTPPTPPTPPGPGVCVPKGDTSFSFTMKGEGGVIKSIQRTNGSGEDCFVRGNITFEVKAPGASIQIALGTTNNFQAGQVRASGQDTARLTLDTSTVTQGEPLFVIARVDRDGAIRDQYYRVVPDNLPPELPTVRPVNKLNPDEPKNRWINKAVTLDLQNPDLRDNPNAPELLASGLKRVVFKAKKIDDTGKLIGKPITIGEATHYPFRVNWDTRTVQDGRYLVYAVAEDAMGNVNRDPDAPVSGFVVGVDNTAPTIDLAVKDKGPGGVTVTGDRKIDIFSAQPGFVSGVAQVTYCAEDGGVGIPGEDLKADLNWGAGNQSLSPAPCGTKGTVDIDVNKVDDGEVTFTLRAKDALGNEASTSVKVTVDNNAPTLDRLLVNGQATSPSITVRAGDQATFEALASDATTQVREVRFYYAATGGTAPLADGGLLQIARVSSPNYRVVFPVLDPKNLKKDSTPSDLYVIAIAVDQAGNAVAEYTTLKVKHTANIDGGINAAGATLIRRGVPGGVEHEVHSTNLNRDDFSNVLKDGKRLYVAYYLEDKFDGLTLPKAGRLPEGVNATVRRVVEVKDTYPYWLFHSSQLNALLFNEYGHWGDRR